MKINGAEFLQPDIISGINQMRGMQYHSPKYIFAGKIFFTK